MRSPIHTGFEDLPQELPIFPLSGALLLPWGRLPLNIFEPRYLNMTLDALKSARVIGMIQPDHDKTSKAKDEVAAPTAAAEPSVYAIGCAGRIAGFEETDDGRLLISLKGLIRFRVQEELEGRKGYRLVRPAYDDFKGDMEPIEKFELEREKLMGRLKPYLEVQGMRINLDIIKGLSDSTLVTSLCMICPFDPREEQALLEVPTIADRAAMLSTLLEMGVFDGGGKPDGPRQ